MNPVFSSAVHEYAETLLHDLWRSSRGLAVKPSWLCADTPTPFLGLFTMRPFKAGEELCIYEGVRLRTTEALRLQDKSYLMRLGQQSYVDAAPCPHASPARFINDCLNPAGHNVQFDKRPELGNARVVALRDIGAGEEVFVDYGKWYWAGSAYQPARLSFSAFIAKRGIVP